MQRLLLSGLNHTTAPLELREKLAFDSAQRRVDDAAHLEKLEDRIRSRRFVFAAVLQIMRSHDMSTANRLRSASKPVSGNATG